MFSRRMPCSQNHRLRSRSPVTAYIGYMIAWCLVPAVLLALGALPWLGRKATMRARGATGL